MSRAKAIVFDLDGTLVDSAPDLHIAANKVLAEEGASPLDLAQITRFIGHGIPNLVANLRQYRGIDVSRQEAMISAMLRHYLEHPADRTRPYPGAVAALETLKAAGHPLGVCTNKALAPTEEILAKLNLRGFFDVVIGGDSLPDKKPHPAPLLAAFSAIGETFLYVGDSEVDVQTAIAAKVSFALFTKGYRKAPLETLTYRAAFDSFDELPEIVTSMASSQSV